MNRCRRATVASIIKKIIPNKTVLEIKKNNMYYFGVLMGVFKKFLCLRYSIN